MVSSDETLTDRMQNKETSRLRLQPLGGNDKNDIRKDNHKQHYQAVDKEENNTDCRISNEISFSKHVRHVMAGLWKNLTQGRNSSNKLFKERMSMPSKFLDINKDRRSVGFTALSVSNLETIEALIADGTVVASDTFNMKDKQIDGGRHDETSVTECGNKVSDREPVKEQYFRPVHLTSPNFLMPHTIGPIPETHTILRCAPGRRSDLGSVGSRFLSWSGPQSENEEAVVQSLAHLVGRKGGMV